MFLPALFLTPPAVETVNAPRMVKEEDNALLDFAGATLFNNVWNKGNIPEARQLVFQQGKEGGWIWDWPESAGPEIKAYPEIILGRSPWNAVRAGSHLPCLLSKARLSLDFEFRSEATGSWDTSFDFWITSTADPTPKDITCNVTIWTLKHKLEPSYKGRHETLKLGGRTYQAIIQTPTDDPANAWNTLCLVDTESRSSGSVDLGSIMDFLIARGLARPAHFLVTAELGSEVAYGKGQTTIKRFALK